MIFNGFVKAYLIYGLGALIAGLIAYIYFQSSKIQTLKEEIDEQKVVYDAQITSLNTKLKVQLKKCENKNTEDIQQTIVDELEESIKEIENGGNTTDSAIGTHVLTI